MQNISKKNMVSFDEFEENPQEQGKPTAQLEGTWIKKLPLHLFTPVPTKIELHPCIDEEAKGWRKLKSVMDSGASESVQHPDEVPEVEVKPSPGSRIGLCQWA